MPVPFSNPQRRVLRYFLDAVGVGVARVAANGDLLYANRQFLELIGHISLRPSHRSNLKQFIASASWSTLETALQRAMYELTEGEITIESIGMPSRTAHLFLSPLRFPRSTSVVIVALDISELKHTQKGLEESQKSLELLSGRILRLQDEERRRIARDLHDVIGQEVAVVSVTMDRLKKEVGNSKQNIREMVNESVSLLTKIQDEIRSLSYLLHPPMLDELGIASAVGMYVEGFEKRSGIQVSFEVTEDFPRLASEKEVVLFRVVQESLTNILRHSKSKSAQVGICVEHGRATVKVRDNGVGMPPNVLRNLLVKNVQVGVGIPGLRQRLKQLGGTLEIRSQLPGTEISATLSLNEKEQTTAEAEPFSTVQTEPVMPESPFRSAMLRRRVLIADDDGMARYGVKAFLSSQPDIEVCGEAVDGLEAVRMTQQLEPDLVILDVAMPRAGGLSAAHMIREAGLKCRILISAEYPFPGFEKSLRAMHCDGYLLKSRMSSDLLRAIRSVLADQKFYSPTNKQIKALASSAILDI